MLAKIASPVVLFVSSETLASSSNESTKASLNKKPTMPAKPNE